MAAYSRTQVMTIRKPTMLPSRTSAAMSELDADRAAHAVVGRGTRRVPRRMSAALSGGPTRDLERSEGGVTDIVRARTGTACNVSNALDQLIHPPPWKIKKRGPLSAGPF